MTRERSWSLLASGRENELVLEGCARLEGNLELGLRMSYDDPSSRTLVQDQEEQEAPDDDVDHDHGLCASSLANGQIALPHIRDLGQDWPNRAYLRCLSSEYWYEFYALHIQNS